MAQNQIKAVEECRYVLFMYCLAIIVAIPIWWRLTEIYRVHLFESLDYGRDVDEHLTPTLIVRLCFRESSAIHTESRDSIETWSEMQINNLIRSSDRVKISSKFLIAPRRTLANIYLINPPATRLQP